MLHKMFALIAALAAFVAAAPPESKIHARTLSMGGVGKEPKFTLDITAAGRMGTVVVKNLAGAKYKRLPAIFFGTGVMKSA